MTYKDFSKEETWEEGTLTIELKRFGPLWWRLDCVKLGEACNSERGKRRNGTYFGRGVQRIYIVQQPDL